MVQSLIKHAYYNILHIHIYPAMRALSGKHSRKERLWNASAKKCKMRVPVFLLVLCVCYSRAQENSNSTARSTDARAPLGCVCGVFFTGQIKRGSKEPPRGNPALLHEHADALPCSNLGNKLCISRCLDVIVKHLPNSPAILCGSVDRAIYKERAHLFIKNCKDEWINTNLSAGREYCCRDSVPYKCPI